MLAKIGCMLDASDDDDDDFTVTLASSGHVYGAEGACHTGLTVWDELLPSLRSRERLERLQAECHLAAWPLARQSFWLPADATPEGPLEELAMQILRFHIAGASPSSFPLHAIGAEWWANVSKSEAIARDGTGDIHLHFDKDEHALERYGVVVHPLLATVTYLSDGTAGAPTVVLPYLGLSHDLQGYARSPEAPEPTPSAVIVPPKVGRHLRFDGRWLHGAPAGYVSLAAKDEAGAGAAGGASGRGKSGQSHVSSSPPPFERITFCVNIWVGHRPGRAPRFAERSDPLALAMQRPRGGDGSYAAESALGAVAPRMRLTMARGAAAVREEKAAVRKQVVMRCEEEGAGKGEGEGQGEGVALRLEQTERLHEIRLPRPEGLVMALREGNVVRLHGRSIAVSQAREESEEGGTLAVGGHAAAGGGEGAPSREAAGGSTAKRRRRQ